MSSLHTRADTLTHTPERLLQPPIATRPVLTTTLQALVYLCAFAYSGANAALYGVFAYGAGVCDRVCTT